MAKGDSRRVLRLATHAPKKKAVEAVRPRASGKVKAHLKLNALQMRCLACGAKGDLTLDHIIPISLPWGRNTKDNYQPLCRDCNQKKANRVIDFRPDKSSLLPGFSLDCHVRARKFYKLISTRKV